MHEQYTNAPETLHPLLPWESGESDHPHGRSFFIGLCRDGR